MTDKQPEMDLSRKFVRLIERRPDGFVEFEFAIGDPALCAELMLKEDDFHTFCLANDVIVLGDADAGQGDWAARLNRASLRNGEESGEVSGEENEAPTTKGHTHGN